MIGLKLRDEFLGAHMPGTAIVLRTSEYQGTCIFSYRKHMEYNRTPHLDYPWYPVRVLEIY